MRIIQVFFSINVVVTIALLAFLVKGYYDLAFSDIIDLINLIFDGISLWLIWQRKRAARFFIIGFSLFNIVIGTTVNIVSGTFSPLNQVMLCLSDIILLIYFLTSRRAKAVLTRPLASGADKAELDKEINYYQPKKWSFWRNLIIYFCVFSVVGHWMEAGYCTLIRFGLIPGTYDPDSQIWSDWLYPFLVYGFGVVACILILFPFKNFLQKKFKGVAIPLILSFIVNALVCTLIELVMGLMLNQPNQDGVYPLWDYSDMFCNFMGQVCLQNALAFGFISTLMTWIIYPGMEKLLAKVPKDIMTIVFVAVVIGFCILYVLYYVDAFDILSIDLASLDVDGSG